MSKDKDRKAPPAPAAPRRVSDEESELWRDVMGSVRKLDRRPPATERQAPPPPAPRVKRQAPRPRPAPVVTPRPKPQAPPLEIGSAPGVDKRTHLRLRRGQIETQGVIDLHGLTQVEAHRALLGFIEGAFRAGKRAVLVITGKGLSPGAGVLRQSVPRWLNEPALRQMILAFSHAQPKDGGEGALYVLIKRKR